MGVNKATLNTPDGKEIVFDISNDTVTEETLFLGETAHGKDGELKTGTFTLAEEMSEQDSLIEQIKTALNGKAAGGGSKTVSVTITASTFVPCIYLAEDGTVKEVSGGNTITDDILYGVVIVDGTSSQTITVTGEYFVINFANFKRVYYFLNDGSTVKTTASSGGAGE